MSTAAKTKQSLNEKIQADSFNLSFFLIYKKKAYFTLYVSVQNSYIRT